MPIERDSYQLVVRYKIKALDPIEAKDKAKVFINTHDLDHPDCELKLQKIEKDKPPSGISLPFLKNE